MANWLTDIFGWSDNKGLEPIKRKSLQKWGDKSNSYLHNQHNYYYGHKKTIKHPFDKYNPEDGGYTDGTTDVIVEKDPDSPDFGKRRFRTQGEQGGSSEMTEKLDEREDEVHKPISDNKDTTHDYSAPKARQNLDVRKSNRYSDGTREDTGGMLGELRGDVEHMGAGNWNSERHFRNSGPMPQSADRGKAQAQYEKFHEDYAVANRNLNMENQSMLNDLKTKQVIDQIASEGGQNPPILPVHDAKFQGSNYTKNATSKYEKRYEDNPHSIGSPKSPYKFPMYSAGVYDDSSTNSRIDKYNALSVLEAVDDSGETKNLLKQDLLPMYFEDLVNKKYIPFRAYINSMSDSFEGKWNSSSYLGRADEVHVYSGCGRTFTIDFTVMSMSIDELHPMWQRINHLVGLTKPANYTNPTERGSSSFIIPPFVKFNLGDIYKHQPAIITQIGMDIPNEGNWELVDNTNYTDKKTKGNKQYTYLNDTIKRNGVKSARYPTAVKLNVSMTFLEKRTAETQIRHFGDDDRERATGINAAEDVPGTPDTFNHELIHYNKAKV